MLMMQGTFVIGLHLRLGKRRLTSDEGCVTKISILEMASKHLVNKIVIFHASRPQAQTQPHPRHV